MPELTEDQKAAVAACDETLRAVNLLTYTEMEEKMYAILAKTLESIEIGKQLHKWLDKALAEVEELKSKAQKPVRKNNLVSLSEDL